MSGPRPLRALLDAWSPAAPRDGGGDEAARLAAAWPEAVGQDIARRTRAGKYREGTLSVLTAGSAWSHQLTFLAPTIIERLRMRAPSVPLRRLRFVVATGRTRILLDRDANVVKGPASRRRENGPKGPLLQAKAPALQDRTLEEIVAELRLEQAALDARRAAAGWRRCDRCGVWRAGSAGPKGPISPCEPCDQAARRASDGRIARVLRAAPWQAVDDVVRAVAGATKGAVERVQRMLRSDWERHLQHAGRRLRRGALEAGDRVTAWSFVMLAAQRPQSDIGRAAVEASLGREWAEALFDETARTSKSTR
jgi:Dna[CI] antecedent, DciA